MSSQDLLADIRNDSFSDLSHVLRRNVDRVIDLFVSRLEGEAAHTLSPPHRADLKDRLPDFLGALADTLEVREPHRATQHHLLAVEHGEQRWQIGWELGDVISDYLILRVVLIQVLTDELSRNLTIEELLVVGVHLDEAISRSVVAFVEHQQAQLKLAHQRVNEFLGILGHELRNPLNALSIAIQLMEKADPQKRTDLLGVMQTDLSAMVRLTDDMCDTSRVMRGRLELRTEMVDLDDVLRRAMQQSSCVLAARQIDLAYRITSPRILLLADGLRLQQVFVNLLTNAAKFSAIGGKVTVSASLENNEAVVHVEDRGVGIEPGLLPSIFELFTQGAENSHSGLGVGLALARALTELHRGRIEAHSEGPGRGSRFSVFLPIADQPEVSQLITKAANNPEEIELPAARRVLIADDRSSTASMLASLLRECGQETFIAYDGADALVLAEQQRPEVLIIDVVLPTVNGYDVARKLRARKPFEKALLIAVTAYSQENQAELTRAAGFDHHLIKPLELRTLLRLISEWESEQQSASNDPS